jgi:hypothetical protein
MATNGNATSTNAPPKADAAPGGTSKFAYNSLCDAMNSQEQQYVKDGKFEIANVYDIVFAPASLASAKVTTKGPTDKTQTPMQQENTAVAAISSDKNSVNTQAKNLSASQGTQIVQFIEKTIRNSSYITDQQLASPDPLNPIAALIPNTTTKGTGPTTWFKILVTATPIGNRVDTKRNDYAYNIKYFVTTYAINDMQSDYFPEARFRGAHKVYNYWFTGLNTQVLHFEQHFNTVYRVVAGAGSIAEGIKALQSPSNAQTDKVGDVYTLGPPIKTPNPPNQTVQSATNDANTPAATAADFLYSANDQNQSTIKIVGDPAWLFQGELVGVTEESLTNATGWWPDGTICSEKQDAVFVINFNTPADYNNGENGPYSGTGLMDINLGGTKGNSDKLSKTATEASAAYKATAVVSTFSRGKFEQSLTGTRIKNLAKTDLNQYRPPVVTKKITPTTPATPTTISTTRKPLAFEEGPNGAAFGNPLASRRGQKYGATQVTPAEKNSATSIINPSVAPTKAAGAPTSEGVPVGSAKAAATSPAPISKAAAQNISQTQRAYQNATEELRQARKYYPKEVAAAQQAVNTARNAWKSAVDASQTPDTQTGASTQTMAPKDQ